MHQSSLLHTMHQLPGFLLHQQSMHCHQISSLSLCPHPPPFLPLLLSMQTLLSSAGCYNLIFLMHLQEFLLCPLWKLSCTSSLSQRELNPVNWFFPSFLFMQIIMSCCHQQENLTVRLQEGLTSCFL